MDRKQKSAVVDLIIQSTPLSDKEPAEISEFIEILKAKRMKSARIRKKAVKGD